MKKVLAILLTVMVSICFVACGGGSSEETASNETPTKNPLDSVKSIELNTVEEGIAYWDVWISDDVDWESLGFVDQSEVAIAAIVDCVSREETPDAEHCWVDAFQGPDGNVAFSWSIDQSDKIIIYKNDGSKDAEYLLEQDDVDKIMSAKS